MSRPLDVPENEVTPQVQSAHWGKRLREIREANNISLAEVVAELRLESRLVQQIENEEQGELPEAPFVKGYLRNYARMLGVDAAPILEAYGQVCGADAPGLTQVNRVRELTSRSAAPRSTTWIIVAVLVVSVLVWWWSQLLSFKNGAEEPVAPEIEAPMQEQVAPVSAVDGATGEAVIELALPQQQPQAQPLVQQPAAPAAVTAALPAQASAAAVAAQPVNATITLKLSQESWIDISDASGARLFMDMAKGGTTQTVTGLPPFKVMLGNSPAVALEYNGAPYDHQAHAKKGIARFTLGAAE